MATPLEQKIETIITPSITEMGYDIVRVKLFDGEPKRLQIMAERASDHRLGMEDCTKISRAVSDVLDADDPITDAYNLEVSSPGIDRPLVRMVDFTRYAGHETKIVTRMAVDGRKRFTGELCGITKEGVVTLRISNATEPMAIALENIESAKLVMTDKLLKLSS